MFDKLKKIEERYAELSQMLGDPEVVSDRKKYTAVAKEQSDLQETIDLYEKYKSVHQGVQDAREIFKETDDPEMKELAQAELDELEEKESKLIEEIKYQLVPKDPNDS
jgi:peptide chain release factor 1